MIDAPNAIPAGTRITGPAQGQDRNARDSINGLPVVGYTNSAGVASVEFDVTPQPSNDYEFVAGTNMSAIEELTRLSLQKNAAPGFSPDEQPSQILAVWRTLYVERDVMAAAPVGTPNAPATAQEPVPIDLMISVYRNADIVVDYLPKQYNVKKTTAWNPLYTQTDKDLPGFDSLDVTSQPGFWCVQLTAAYKGRTLLGEQMPGIAPLGTNAVVFTATAQKVYSDNNAIDHVAITEDEYLQRVALHESGHLMGLAHYEGTNSIMPPFAETVLYMKMPSYGWFMPFQFNAIESVVNPGSSNEQQ